MRRIAWWAALMLALSFPALAQNATFVTITADAGDTSGVGTFTSTSGSMTVSTNGRGGVSVVFQGSGVCGTVPCTSPLMFFDFGPPQGVDFAPGRFEIPQRFPVAAAGRPAMEVYESTHCSAIAGRFILRQLDFAPDHSIASLAIDFDQYCDGNTAGIHGGVRFNSYQPYAPESLPRSVTGDTALGPATLSIVSPDVPCQLLATQFVPDPSTGPFSFPYGLFPFRAAGCDPSLGPAHFTLDLPTAPTGKVAYWKYGPTPDVFSAHWYTIPITVTGNTVSFDIQDDQLGDDDLASHGITYSYGGLTVGPGVQDMWWAGPQENGWGMSIVQHGGTLFCVIYMYDDSGKPTWLVMPGGDWSAPYRSYSGALYRPHGSPYYAFDSAAFTAGAPVGTATLAFADFDHATLDYTVDGIAGHKDIVRQLFGPPAVALPDDHGDLWWGGPADNGYGIAMLQQNATMFSVWFTYDASGAPTWFVMPGGAWTDSTLTTYAGRVYQTTGSPWVGKPYDASRLRATDVGSFQVHFDAPTSPFQYSILGHEGTLQLSRQPF